MYPEGLIQYLTTQTYLDESWNLSAEDAKEFKGFPGSSVGQVPIEPAENVPCFALMYAFSLLYGMKLFMFCGHVISLRLMMVTTYPREKIYHQSNLLSHPAGTSFAKNTRKEIQWMPLSQTIEVIAPSSRGLTSFS